MSANQKTRRTRSQLSESGSMQKRAYERHRSKVRAATPTVDVEPPRPRPHVLYNAKGLQLQRERQAVITQDNFILLKNLRNIMERSSKKTNNSLAKPRSKCMRTR